MFLEIGLKFRYHVAVDTGHGIGSHGFDRVPRCNDAVYDPLSRLKGIVGLESQSFRFGRKNRPLVLDQSVFF